MGGGQFAKFFVQRRPIFFDCLDETDCELAIGPANLRVIGKPARNWDGRVTGDVGFVQSLHGYCAGESSPTNAGLRRTAGRGTVIIPPNGKRPFRL